MAMGPSEIHRPLCGSQGPRPMYWLNHPLISPGCISKENYKIYIQQTSNLNKIGVDITLTRQLTSKEIVENTSTFILKSH